VKTRMQKWYSLKKHLRAKRHNDFKNVLRWAQECGIVLGSKCSKWDASYYSGGKMYILLSIFNRKFFVPLNKFVLVCDRVILFALTQ